MTAQDDFVRNNNSAAVRGSNQSGMRAHNERLVLSILRAQGPTAKALLARMTGLSAQTVSVITRKLEEEGLILRGAPQRGKVGQPSIPMRLAPEGAYFFGLKVGRRSLDLVLTNFMGQVVSRRHSVHALPEPNATRAFALRGMAELTETLPPHQRDRIAGLGIAIPFQLWNWAGDLGVPPERMAAWRDADLPGEIGAETHLPIFLQNDASAACGAELVFGDAPSPRDFLYFYIGYFIGGGVVLNGSLYTGRTGNAGALGSMPVPLTRGGTGQLIDMASLSVLERTLRNNDLSETSLWSQDLAWDVPQDRLDDWIDRAASGIASAISAAACVLDLEAVLIDGWLPVTVRAKLVEAVRTALDRHDLTGIEVPEVREGSVGPDARVLGAASLPLSEKFLLDRDALLKPV